MKCVKKKEKKLAELNYVIFVLEQFGKKHALIKIESFKTSN